MSANHQQKQTKGPRAKTLKRWILASAGAALAVSLGAACLSQPGYGASAGAGAGSAEQVASGQTLPIGPASPVTAMAVRWQ